MSEQGWLLNKLKDYNSTISMIYKGKTFTYDQLYNKVIEMKETLSQKIKSGEVVSILSDYSFDSVALLMALFSNKCIIVPITSNVESEIRVKVQESCSDWIIKIANNIYEIEYVKHQTIFQKPPILESLKAANHSGIILFSSGSTGKPKAILLDFDNLVNSYRDKKAKHITVLIFLMFDHIGGINTLLNSLSMGAKLIIPESRDPDKVCELIQKYQVDLLPTTPTFLNLMLISEAYKKYDLSSLKLITYGAEPMPEVLLSKLRSIFPKVRFIQTFGTTETGIAPIYTKSSISTLFKIDNPEYEFKIVENELYLRSKIQAVGYLNANMNDFTEDGWFKTGDIVEVTEDGYLKIIGRKKDLINVGGEKVIPNEVESVILSLAEIDDVLVYGEPNPITGEIVVCDVVVAKGVNLSEKEITKLIRQHCKNKLDKHKIPVKVNILDKIDYTNRFKKIRPKHS